MKRVFFLIPLLFVAALLTGCGGDAGKAGSPTNASSGSSAPSNQLIINGSTTLLPIVQKSVDAYQKQKPELKISLSGGGSGIGINALIDKINDIAMSSRELKPEEKEKLGKRKIEAKAYVAAWDGIVPIVHPTNPVKNITIGQLRDIYAGKIKDWREIGGKKGPIVVISRDAMSGTHEAWAELVMREEKVVSTADAKTSSEAILDMVAATPNAIGYDGLGYVEGNSLVKPLSVDGVSASAKSILDKSYQLARPLILFTRGNADKSAIDFISFVMSPEGQMIVKEAKYVPVPHE